jgi:ABC-type anion transport system duplicated permease subunit
VLGMVVMALYVLAINRLLWRPLSRLAEERFQI